MHNGRRKHSSRKGFGCNIVGQGNKEKNAFPVDMELFRLRTKMKGFSTPECHNAMLSFGCEIQNDAVLTKLVRLFEEDTGSYSCQEDHCPAPLHSGIAQFSILGP